MIKKLLVVILICLLLPYHVLAQESSDQEYINKLTYRRNKLELVTKKRQVDETSSYSYTDVDTYTYTYEAYSQSSTDISTQSYGRAEKREITEWYIYKGEIRTLSDPEFLALVGDKETLSLILKEEEQKANMRNYGNILIGTGLAVMLGGIAFSVPQGTVTGGALGMAVGFMISAFNSTPQHYIQPDYAQEKIDEYNINLKRQLGLPLDFN